jgi:hypothetical protein
MSDKLTWSKSTLLVTSTWPQTLLDTTVAMFPTACSFFPQHAVFVLPLNTLSFCSRQTHHRTQWTSKSNTLHQALAVCLLTRSHQLVIKSVAVGTWLSQPHRLRVACQTSRANEQPSNRSRSSEWWVHRAQSAELWKPCRWQRSDIQQRPRIANHIKKIHFLRACVFHSSMAPRMEV